MDKRNNDFEAGHLTGPGKVSVKKINQSSKGLGGLKKRNKMFDKTNKKLRRRLLLCS